MQVVVVSSIKSVVEREFYCTAVILIYEIVGAGGREFAITSFLNNCDKNLPKELNYVSVTKTKEEVLREIKLMIPSANTGKLFEKMNVYSLANVYFKDTIIPMRWVGERRLEIESLKEGKKRIIGVS